MLREFREWLNNARAIVLAILVHVIAIAILVVNLEWFEPSPKPVQQSAPVQATTVNKQAIEKELARQQAEEKRKLEEERKRLQKIEQEKKRLAELERKRKVEEKRQKEEAIKKKKAEEKRKKELALKKKKEEEARKKAVEEKKLAEKKKREAEKKRLAEKKKREELARKKKLEEERKKKELAKKKRLEQERLAKAREQKRREEALMQALEDEMKQSKIDQYIALIREDVQNNWYIPATARTGMECVLLIRLFPSGEVQSVQVTQTSGDPVFDKSVQDAVYRASPLPVSSTSAGDLFQSKFREFNFRFTPKKLRS
ncbi:MAG: cell envelope integrity protein TolA [Gammaproteobacteria bacterium]|nr:MAG: cell envelope integrity protein TolA [Gammaproteobacteria bacterium]